MEPPARFEAGTQPVAQVVAAGVAADWLMTTGVKSLDKAFNGVLVISWFELQMNRIAPRGAVAVATFPGQSADRPDSSEHNDCRRHPAAPVQAGDQYTRSPLVHFRIR